MLDITFTAKKLGFSFFQTVGGFDTTRVSNDKVLMFYAFEINIFTRDTSYGDRQGQMSIFYDRATFNREEGTESTSMGNPIYEGRV